MEIIDHIPVKFEAGDIARRLRIRPERAGSSHLEELIKLFIAKGILVRRGKEWHATSVPAGIAIPYTVEGIIRARYARCRAPWPRAPSA